MSKRPVFYNTLMGPLAQFSLCLTANPGTPFWMKIVLKMSQYLTEGTFWQLKSIVRFLQRKKDLAIVDNYRKFEEIIFTNNKDMSV